MLLVDVPEVRHGRDREQQRAGDECHGGEVHQLQGEQGRRLDDLHDVDAGADDEEQAADDKAPMASDVKNVVQQEHDAASREQGRSGKIGGRRELLQPCLHRNLALMPVMFDHLHHVVEGHDEIQQGAQEKHPTANISISRKLRQEQKAADDVNNAAKTDRPNSL